MEGDNNSAGRAISLLSQDDVSLASTRMIALINTLAVEQDDNVGVLLQRTGLSQVRDFGTLVLLLLCLTVELRKGNHWDLEFLGQ